ncbi:MAG: GlsB/YeaQ/YmgE family stress response membrane protein [Angustibacter sp.]
MITVLTFLVLGALAGAIARLLVPGKDSLGLVGTILLGILGSFIGGFLGYLFLGEDFADGALQPSGVIGSIIGAILALLAYRAATRSNSRH